MPLPVQAVLVVEVKSGQVDRTVTKTSKKRYLGNLSTAEITFQVIPAVSVEKDTYLQYYLNVLVVTG